MHHWKQKWWKMIKKWKKLEENCNFSFFGKLQFSSSFFFIFFFIFFIFFHFSSFFIIFHHFSSIPPLEAKMIKNDKKHDKKNDKKMKSTQGKLQFFIFRIIFAPLEAKMMKHEKTMKKKWKKPEENCNFSFFGKLQFSSSFFSFFFIFFHFFFIFHIFHHFSSIPPLEAKMIKNDKKMKSTQGKLQFFIFRIIFAPLEAKMMKNEKTWKKNEKKMKKTRKIAIFHFLENCNFPRVLFFIFFSFFSCFFIFHHFSSFFINSTTGSKNDKKW